MGNTIGTAYIQIEPSTQGISGAISDALNKDAGSAGKTAGGTLSSALGTAAKVGVTAIAGATAAVGAFGKSAVDAGATFSSSMSQVAATMGYSVKDLNTQGSEAQKTFQTLSDFAQEMGSTTAFSASQAADALNYMALAGYDADTSMKMLPNVLNLAAAGGIELASASDMVTDAQSALGLSLDQTSVMVDQMAKASSKSNTSVAQLGEAFLTVGATAKGLSGGTNELSTALGLLADNGIKGAEGGTHLRNIMLAMNPTTSKACDAWEKLGISAYDADGNLRPLQDTFADLNKAMDGMTEQQKTDLLTAMFNKTDLSSINALLATSSERWNELSEAIGDSAGAAEEMENVQLDNLNGDITLFQSALEGVQIAVSEQLTPTLREFVQFGGNGLQSLTEAFKSNGLSGAMEVAGQLIGELLTKIVGMLPSMIDAGMKLLAAIGQGLLQNLPTIVNSAVQIVTTLVGAVIQAIPQLIVAAGKIIQALVSGITQALPLLIAQGAELLNNLGQGMSENMPEIVENALTMVQNLVKTLAENAPILISAAVNFFLGLAEGLAESLPTLIEMIPQIVTDLANIINDNMPTILKAGVQIIITLGKGLIQAIPTLVKNIPQIIKALVAVWEAFNWVSLGTKAINMLKNGILAVKGAVGTAGKNILEAITNALKNLPSKLMSIGKNGFTKLGSTIKGMKSTISSAVKTIFNTVVNGVKNLPSKLKSIGKDLITGLWNGISDKIGWITGKIQGFGESVISSIKDIFGVHSPSKVMEKEVGKFLPEGLAVGIEANSDSVFDAMSSIKDGVLDVANSNNYRIDSSEIIKDNSESQIIELLNKYLPMICNQQIILDSGVLVGQTVSKMDKELGRRYNGTMRGVYA